MNKLVIGISILACSILTSFYSPRYVYSPAAHNVPILANKGDSKLAAYYSSNLNNAANINLADQVSSRGRGWDMQGAYAVSNHLAVQAAYFNRSEINFSANNISTDDTSTIKYNRNLTEAGIGYYTNLGRRGTTSFQLFAGAGTGKFTLSDTYHTGPYIGNPRFFNSRITKLYLQPSFIFKPAENFSTAFANRISWIKYNHITTNYSSEEKNKYQLSKLASSTLVFYEPAFITSFGLPQLPGLQAELQMGYAIITSKEFVNHRGFNFSVGLKANFKKIFGQKNRHQKN